jgi:DNA-binding winged helix-turn-helix (wHTH) protein/tetratricopeptide (TPR) repeat protein
MEDSAYRFAGFSIWPSERRLVRGSETISLPPKAFDALLFLVRNHGSLVSRDDIVHALWPDTYVSEANLTNIVVVLRRNLGRDSIETVSKSGYRFMLPVVGEPGIRHAAYASFIRGKELLTERSLPSISSARDHFVLSIAEDPQFATAWAWLGRTCRLLEKFKGERSPVPSLAAAAFRRAFLIDPDLACAHQFYTQVQVDAGQSLQAMMRLAPRIKRFKEEPEILAGLVQVLRCCGLLDESVAVHQRAIALDPTIRTSVTHTFFLLGDYPALLETYVGRPYYLDAAAWVALGQRERAASLLRTRISWPDLGPLMQSLIGSLLAVLEGREKDALEILEQAQIDPEPEGLFYLARHCGLLNHAASALKMIERARVAGFWSSYALEHDSAFQTLRSAPDFIREIENSKGLEAEARRIFDRELATIFI